MTGLEAVRWADALAPNDYTTEQKIAWLSDLDGKFYREFLSRYEGVDGEWIDAENVGEISER